MAEQNIDAALAGTTNTIKTLSPAEILDLESVIPRWSLLGVSAPYAIVTPSSSKDVLAVIDYAREHKLMVLPTAGGHSPFTPVTSNTIYLSMSKFKNISLDQAAGVVELGGGVLTGEVLKALGDQGWHTCVPNSNKVGLIGALMGAMHHSTIGIHGIGSQNLEEVTIIPFSMPDGSSPRELKLRRDSVDESERRLFNVLCEAGFGLGVITSVKLAAWRISDLNMTNDQVWTRSIIFPPTAIEAAARACLSLRLPPPALKPTTVFMRAPPTAPRPGAPMILLALSYFGPKEDVEHYLDDTIPKDALGQAINVTTAPTDFAKINDPYAPMSRHGGFKEFEGGFLEQIDEVDIVGAFQLFLEFTNANIASRAGSSFLISTWNPTAVGKYAANNKLAFVPYKGRSIFVQATPWYGTLEERQDASTYARGVYEALASKDASAGRRKWSFVNNVRIGSDMQEVFTKGQTREIVVTKELFDKYELGWNVVANGWLT